MQSVRPGRAILSAQGKQRMVAHRHLGWRLVVKEERYSLHGPQGHLRERRECDSWTAARRQAGGLHPDQHNCSASVLFKLSQLSGRAVAGEWMMWEFAICSNFIFSCHSRESQCLTGDCCNFIHISSISYIVGSVLQERSELPGKKKKST